MNDIARQEDEWQARATAAAIAAAKKIVLGNPSLKVAHVGRLSDHEWGWIITAAIFAWVQTRCEQATAEGLDQETAVRMTGLRHLPVTLQRSSQFCPSWPTTPASIGRCRSMRGRRRR